jgi:succinyl-diaminopimelate desuccinylase
VVTADSWEREILDFAVELVRIPTANPPGEELRAAELVGRFLTRPGVEVRLQRVTEGRANVIARLRGRGTQPALVFSGHLDTVPVGPDAWSSPPYGGDVRGGRLFGRGSADMKGAIAAMAVVLRDLATSGVTPAGDIVLALTAGEEVDSCGARLMVESGILDDMGMLVVGEMTGLDVGCAHKGLLWVAVETHGIRGHGATGGRDANAIAGLVDWLHPLETLDDLVPGEHPVLGRGHVSVNQISGGDAPNVAPASASAVLDVRTLPHHDHTGLVAALRARRPGASVSVLREGQPIATAPDASLIEAAAAAVTDVLGRPAVIRGLPYLTDASVLLEGRAVPTVVLGPGTEAEAHAVDESIEIAALGQAARIYRGIADRLMLGL